MFVFKADHEYWWKVEVRVPSEGRHQTFDFEARFRRIPVERMRELGRSGDDAALMREVLVGWRHVQDEDGAPVEFNDATRDLALSDPHVLVALGRAYVESVEGAVRKN